MYYVSTRDHSLQYTPAQAIAQGLSRDGGLFLPVSIPKLPEGALKKMTGMTYQQRAQYIMSLYLEDFTAEELGQFAEKAYGPDKFDTPAVAPLKKVDDGTYCLELWHGPTCAFKDMALQMLPHLLTASLKKNQEEKTVCILVATSGDTGKAALEGLQGRGSRPSILVFYPKDGVSDIQQLQMATQEGANVGVSAVVGNFDDAQTGVKTPVLRRGPAGRSWHSGATSSPRANSINWGRVLPQIVYYISAYCDLLAQGADDRRGAGEFLRAHRQLRQHPGRLLRQGDGSAHRPPALRLQQQQRPHRFHRAPASTTGTVPSTTRCPRPWTS